MKKIVFSVVSFFIFFSLFAFSLTLTDVKIKLVATIAHSLVKKKVVCVDLMDKEFLNRQKGKIDHIVFVNSCQKADIIITDNIKQIKKSCISKLIFVTNYNTYIHTPFAVGALFWQKGRPVLIFNKKTIKAKHIRLPKQFYQFVE